MSSSKRSKDSKQERDVGANYGPWPFPDYRPLSCKNKDASPSKKEKPVKPTNERNQKEPE